MHSPLINYTVSPNSPLGRPNSIQYWEPSYISGTYFEDVVFSGFEINLRLDACTGVVEHPLLVSLHYAEDDSEQVSFQIIYSGVYFYNCHEYPPERYNLIAASPNPSGISSGPWKTRYRREYGDIVSHERQTIELLFLGEDSDQSYTGLIFLDSCPTCRVPEISGACECIEFSTVNVVSLSSLPSYEIDPELCPISGDFPPDTNYEGRPIDIDYVCDPTGTSPTTEDEIIPGGVTLYYYPFTDTVPVINNIAYDTTSVPASVSGLATIFELYSGSTRDEIRQFVCQNVKFATIEDPAWTGLANPTDGLNFNWPFNDLYFKVDCENGPVIIVPC